MHRQRSTISGGEASKVQSDYRVVGVKREIEEGGAGDGRRVVAGVGRVRDDDIRKPAQSGRDRHGEVVVERNEGEREAVQERSEQPGAVRRLPGIGERHVLAGLRVRGVRGQLRVRRERSGISGIGVVVRALGDERREEGESLIEAQGCLRA